MRIETIAVHAGGETDPVTGAVTPPIHLSTTYDHGPANEQIYGFAYIRENNPTQARLEEAMAQLEGGAAALVSSSGMAAGAALLQSLTPKSHVIFPDDMYVDFRHLTELYLPKWGIEITNVDMERIDEVRAAIKPNTKLVWLETPSNPLLRISDIEAISKIAHQGEALVIVDNTFATPILQRPLEMDADVVLHATTKYCGGHSDVQGGALVLKRRDALYESLLQGRPLVGGVASPFASWLVLRGLRSLHFRI